MVAPVWLVLGAPVTLLLRSVPVRRARTLSRVLRSRPVHLLANPWVALFLSTGGLVALSFTPLHGASTGQSGCTPPYTCTSWRPDACSPGW
jgi:putative membrane protein